MPYHMMLDLSSAVIQDRKNLRADILTLKDGDRSVLPVFTSLDPFRAFVKAHYTRGYRVNIAPLQVDPFELAGVAGPMEKAGEIGVIAFDPVHGSSGKWESPAARPVKQYCRFVEEIRPELHRLAAENRSEFDALAPGTEAFREALMRHDPRLDKIAEGAVARIEGAEAGDGR